MPVLLLQIVAIALLAYLWGSIPWGYWIGKLLRGKDFDIRAYGSHKIGATNVLRTLGRGPALVVFILDLSKGLVPVLIAQHTLFLGANGWGPAIAALLALLGHCFPIFIGFKGGRGVATGAGSVLLLSPLAFLIAAVIGIGSIVIWRYVSLGSILGGGTILVCGILFFILGALPLPTLLFFLIGPSLVIFFHSDNINRLRAGSERKIGQKESIADTQNASHA